MTITLGLGQSRIPKLLASPIREAGAQALGAISAAFPDVLEGSWIRSGGTILHREGEPERFLMHWFTPQIASKPGARRLFWVSHMGDKGSST